MFLFAVPHARNAALGKPAWQTSTGYEAVPERAVDGNRNNVFAGGSCTHTREDDPAPAVWGVDLKSTMPVYQVAVTNTDIHSGKNYVK